MSDAKGFDALTPYARSLGIELAEWEDDTPVLRVAFEEAVEAGYTAAQKAIAKGSLTEFCYGPGSAARPKGVDLHEV